MERCWCWWCSAHGTRAFHEPLRVYNRLVKVIGGPPFLDVETEREIVKAWLRWVGRWVQIRRRRWQWARSRQACREVDGEEEQQVPLRHSLRYLHIMIEIPSVLYITQCTYYPSKHTSSPDSEAESKQLKRLDVEIKDLTERVTQRYHQLNEGAPNFTPPSP